MWLEVSPGAYEYGIGFFGEEPGLMAEFRKFLREDSEEFIRAALSPAQVVSVTETEENSYYVLVEIGRAHV